MGSDDASPSRLVGEMVAIIVGVLAAIAWWVHDGTGLAWPPSAGIAVCVLVFVVVGVGAHDDARRARQHNERRIAGALAALAILGSEPIALAVEYRRVPKLLRYWRPHLWPWAEIERMRLVMGEREIPRRHYWMRSPSR